MTDTIGKYDIPFETQKIFIEQEMQLWKNSAYVAELRARVARKTGDEEDAKKFQADMEKCYKRIDELEKELTGITLKLTTPEH